MTTPAAIIDVVSRRLGVARPTVALQDRLLAAAGHRRVSGRGRAARATPDDASALLVAVAATPVSGPAIKETILNYERYAGLIAVDQSGDFSAWELKHLNELAPGHNLKDALTAIIRAIASGQIEQASDLWERAKPDIAPVYSDVDIIVQLDAPTPFARITVRAKQRRSISLDPPDLVAEFSAEMTYAPTAEALQKYFETLPETDSGTREGPDLEQSRRFGLATLEPVAMLFRNDAKVIKT